MVYNIIICIWNVNICVFDSYNNHNRNNIDNIIKIKKFNRMTLKRSLIFITLLYIGILKNIQV